MLGSFYMHMKPSSTLAYGVFLKKSSTPTVSSLPYFSYLTSHTETSKSFYSKSMSPVRLHFLTYPNLTPWHSTTVPLHSKPSPSSFHISSTVFNFRSIIEQLAIVFHMFKKKSGYVKDFKKAQIKLLEIKITVLEMKKYIGWN